MCRSLDMHELEWWRTVFMTRLSADSIELRPGQALYGRRFLLTEVLPSEVDATGTRPAPAPGWSGGLSGAFC